MLGGVKDYGVSLIAGVNCCARLGLKAQDRPLGLQKGYKKDTCTNCLPWLALGLPRLLHNLPDWCLGFHSQSLLFAVSSVEI